MSNNIEAAYTNAIAEISKDIKVLGLTIDEMERDYTLLTEEQKTRLESFKKCRDNYIKFTGKQQ